MTTPLHIKIAYKATRLGISADYLEMLDLADLLSLFQMYSEAEEKEKPIQREKVDMYNLKKPDIELEDDWFGG